MEDGHFLAERSDRMELAAGENQILVDLIADDGQAVPLGDRHKVDNVRPREDRSAGIGGIVVDDGAGTVVNLRLQVLQVNLPAALRQEVVVADFNAQQGGQRFVEGKAGARDEDVAAGAGQHGQRQIECVRAARGDDNVLWWWWWW